MNQDNQHPSKSKYSDKCMCPACGEAKIQDFTWNDQTQSFTCPKCGQDVEC